MTPTSRAQAAAAWWTILSIALALGTGCGDAPTRPHVILFTIESLRPDHVGAYGGGSRTRPDVPTTPALDGLAREAMVYERAHAVTSWTLTSHASLFTGLYPPTHRTVRPHDTLEASYTTLAELLAQAGYETAAFVTGPYLRRPYNLHQGFARYHDELASAGASAAHDDVTNPALEAALDVFLARPRDAATPLFLFVYVWDPHYDYRPPPPFDRTFVTDACEPFDLGAWETRTDLDHGVDEGRLAWALAQYAGEVRATDAMLGRLFARLRRAGLWDDALVIVTADHGEEFFDHGGRGHKGTVYQESVHVPLIVRYPGGTRRGRDRRLVSLVDVMPTVLEATGVAPPPLLHGRSLLASPLADRAIFFDLLALRYRRNDDGRIETTGTHWRAVRQAERKLLWVENVRDADDYAVELFDLAADPGEQRTLAAERPAEVRVLATTLADLLVRFDEDAARFEPAPRAVLDPAETARLQALGYLDAD